MPPIRKMLFFPGYILILLCVGEARGSDWTTAYSRARKHVIGKNKLLTTLPEITKEWRVGFDVYPASYSARYASVLHLTIGGKGVGSSAKVGDRTPPIWFHKTRGVLVSTAQDGKASYSKFFKPLPLAGEWTRMEVSQTLVSSQYMYSITIGNEQVFSKPNTKPVELSDVKVYAGSPWSSQKGSLRKLKIEIKTPDCATGEIHFHFYLCQLLFSLTVSDINVNANTFQISPQYLGKF